MMAETIGQRLKKTREYRNLTFEKVAEATRIRSEYLRALEADDLSAMPSPVHARGFLRNYAQYLGLDLDQILDEIRIARQESGAEAEVIFEGAQPASPSPQQEPAQEVETADEPVAEPFWQTWLKRVKSESGEVDESPASPPDPEPAPVSEPPPLPETPDKDAEEGSAPKTTVSFVDWVRNNLHKLEADEASADAPEAELEPRPEPEPAPAPETPEPVANPASQPELSSQEIINEIGTQLRQRRELLSLTLDEIERHTRMRAQFMDALERGNFDELPSPVQLRGMLSNYASFLDLDVDALLLRFADALQARHRERHPERPARRRGQPNIPETLPALRTFIAGDVIFGVGIVLLLVVFSIWGISRVIALQSEQQAEVQAEATGVSISEALIGTPVETVVSEVTLIPVEDTPIPSLAEGTFEIPTLAVDANVQVNLVAVERTYLRVTVDGEVEFDGRTIPGNAYPFDAEQSIEILAGNGAALRVVYNQRDLGLLGGFGQIASFIYTADEILEPTPVVPPTPTLTPFISPTPSITPSPTPTLTPTQAASNDV